MLFVKGIYVCTYSAYKYGINAYELALNRDRAVIADQYRMYRIISALVANVAARRAELPAFVDKIKLLNNIYESLCRRPSHEVHYFHEYVDTVTADELLAMWHTDHKLSSLVMPVHAADEERRIEAELRKKQANKEVYPTSYTHWMLQNTARRSSKFESVAMRLQKLGQAKTYEPTAEQHAIVQRILETIKKSGAAAAFPANSLFEFKDVKAAYPDMQAGISWRDGDKLYLPKDAFDSCELEEDVKYQIFEHVCKLLAISFQQLSKAFELA